MALCALLPFRCRSHSAWLQSSTVEHSQAQPNTIEPKSIPAEHSQSHSNPKSKQSPNRAPNSPRLIELISRLVPISCGSVCTSSFSMSKPLGLGTIEHSRAQPNTTEYNRAQIDPSRTQSFTLEPKVEAKPNRAPSSPRLIELSFFPKLVIISHGSVKQLGLATVEHSRAQSSTAEYTRAPNRSQPSVPYPIWESTKGPLDKPQSSGEHSQL